VLILYDWRNHLDLCTVTFNCINNERENRFVAKAKAQVYITKTNVLDLRVAATERQRIMNYGDRSNVQLLDTEIVHATLVSEVFYLSTPRTCTGPGILTT
jgi:hypothetical protein